MQVKKKDKLSKSERHTLIRNKLKSFPAIRVSELASDIGVSTETIRRDLAELEEEGSIHRTYGGASRPMDPEPGVSERDHLFSRQREAIAQHVVTEVKDGEVLIIGSGATTIHVAVRLAAEKKKLTIFTDSPLIASELAQNPTFKVHLLPGLFNEIEKCVYGPETINYLSRIYANHVILGASGLTGDGVSNFDPEIAETYRAMTHRATNCIVAADHSKIDKSAVSIYAEWNEVSELVTDVEPADEELLLGLKLGHVKVSVVEVKTF